MVPGGGTGRARGGIGGDGPLGLRLWVVILALAGAALVLARRRSA